MIEVRQDPVSEVVTVRGHALASVVGALLLAAGCTSPGQVAPAPVRPAVDGEVMQGLAGDYDPALRPSDLAARSAVTVAGTVRSWSDGRAFQEGADTLSRTAVLEIAVEEVRGDEGVLTARATATAAPGATPSSVFVEVHRGDVAVDEEGNDRPQPPGRSTQLTVDDLRAAAPEGARVVVMGGPARHDSAIAVWGVTVTRSWQPPVEGAVLLSPLPQGLLFEGADGGYVSGIVAQRDVEGHGWPLAEGAQADGEEFEELLAAVL